MSAVEGGQPNAETSSNRRLSDSGQYVVNTLGNNRQKPTFNLDLKQQLSSESRNGQNKLMGIKNGGIATFEDQARLVAQNRSFRHSYPVTCTNNGRPGCITGTGVSHIKSNAIAGRMTLHQLEKMVEGRSNALIEPE